MQKPTPDPRIAAYIEEISRPGTPYVNGSHNTRWKLVCEHGEETVNRLCDEYFAALRVYELAQGIRK